MAVVNEAFNPTNGFQGRLTVSEVSYSIENNNYVISYLLQAVPNDSAQWANGSSMPFPWNVAIDGVVIASGAPTSYNWPAGGGINTIASGTYTVAGNPDGAKSIHFSGLISSYKSATPVTYKQSTPEGDLTLTTIPRASKVATFDSFAIGTNPNMALTVYSAAFTHSIILSVGGSVFATIPWAAGVSSAALDLSTYWATILNAFAAGGLSTTISVTIKTYNGGAQIGSDQTGSTTATTAASTITSFPNLAIEAGYQYVLAKAYSGFTHQVEIKIGSTQIKIEYNANDTVSLTGFTTGQKTAIYNAFVDGATQATFTLYVTTYWYNGSTYKQIGSQAIISAVGTVTASTITTLADFTLLATGSLTGPALTISRASALFTHDIVLSISGVTIATITGVATSATFTLTQAMQDIIYAAIPNAVTGAITATIVTKMSTRIIGSSSTKNATATVPASIVPTFTSITFAEQNAANTTGVYLQNISKIKVTVNGAAGAKSSTITSYYFTFEGVAYYASTGTSETIQSSGARPVSLTITDSRGRTVTGAANVTVQAYTPPQIPTFTVTRCTSAGVDDPLGTYAKFTIVSTATKIPTAGNVSNTFVIKLYSKLHSDFTDWTGVTPFVTITATTLMAYTGTPYYVGYDVLNSYDIKAEFIDIFGTVPINKTLSTGTVPLAITNKGIGAGKIPEVDRTLDSGGPSNIDDTLSVQKQLTLNSPIGTAPMVVISTTKVVNLNADMLEGYHADETAAVSTIAKRTSTGVIAATYFNQSSAAETTTATGYMFYTTDGVIHKKTLANVKIEVVVAADILAKLLTVDGAGSGVDADKLDGKHSSDFVQTYYGGSNPDIDTYRTVSAVYQLYGSTKTPHGSIGVLEVIVYSPDWVVQRWTPIDSSNPNSWQRQWHSGTTWSAWSCNNDSFNGIYEQGSTTGSNWIKYANGRFEVWAYQGTTEGTTSPWGGWFISNTMTYYFSEAMIDDKLAVYGSVTGADLLAVTVEHMYNNAVSFRFTRGASLAAGTTRYVCLHITGRWK